MFDDQLSRRLILGSIVDKLDEPPNLPQPQLLISQNGD